MSKHRSTRTTNSTARRALAGCTIAGAALFATVSGGQAWADGVRTPSPTAPAVDHPDQPAAAPSAPAAKPSQPARPAPAVSQPAAANGAAQPAPAAPSAKGAQPAPAAPAAPTVTPSGAAQPSRGPVPQDNSRTDQPQVRSVPQGAAQAGDGSGALDDAGTKLVGGSAAAAVGAGALGFALLRRRSGARG
ncbi:hypothetical protein OG618_34190 [Kitasatospora sp. NBC_01246]|uniref:hypothetical protein n=1 Tax=Kitasatospora sp. NBC_01246 TaxID=2903570 RepID=UPI002E2F480F|nr:hypothetical protein [Kitasatospora sp. NBC_01246]